MTNTKEKVNTNIIVIVIDYTKVAKGHRPHRSGSGHHKSKKHYKRDKKVGQDDPRASG